MSHLTRALEDTARMAPSLPRLCDVGSLEQVRVALARGEEVNQKDAQGITGLMMAVGRDNEALVDLLLQQPGLDVNLTGGRACWTALHWACHYGHAGIVRRLLAHPYLTCHNAVDSHNRINSPLMMAVEKNRLECVKMLVAVEVVDLETRHSQGYGLEEMARIRGNQEVWQVVREEKRRREVREQERKKEEAKDRLTNENIDNLVDFIVGNEKKMVTQKKKKKTFKQAKNSFERKPLKTSINTEESNIGDNESMSNNEDENIKSLEAETNSHGNCAEDFLNRDIEDKLQVLKDKNKYVEELLKCKHKEIADLILGIDTADDKKSKGIKDIIHIDNQMKELLKKKDMIAEECKKQDEIKEKLSAKKSKLETFISTNITKSKEEINMLEREIKELKTNLDKDRKPIQSEVKDEDSTKLELARQSNMKLLSYIS